MSTNNNRPAFRAYTVTGEGDTARWTDIGVAWATRDKEGFTLQLNALPLDGRIVLRKFKTKSEQEAA